MMFYWVKIIHVVSASLLFGVGVATAIYFVFVNQHKELALIIKANKQVGYVDWLFTALAGVIQPITGFTLIYLKNYPLTDVWWVVVMLGYGLAGVCWFPAVYLRGQCMQLAELAVSQQTALSPDYYRCYHWRCALSVFAFGVLMVVFYFMANTPQV